MIDSLSSTFRAHVTQSVARFALSKNIRAPGKNHDFDLHLAVCGEHRDFLTHDLGLTAETSLFHL
jgi:hypothetical protein